MRNFIKTHSLDILLLIMLIVAILCPGDFSFTISGGIGLATYLFMLLVGLCILFTTIVGGEVSVSSKGLIPMIKSLIKNKRSK